MPAEIAPRFRVRPMHDESACLKNRLTRFQAFDITEIYKMSAEEREAFLDDYIELCAEIKTHRDCTPTSCDETCLPVVDVRREPKRKPQSLPRGGRAEKPLAGDVVPLHDIQIMPVYELAKSRDGCNYKYVNLASNGMWHAQPHLVASPAC